MGPMRALAIFSVLVCCCTVALFSFTLVSASIQDSTGVAWCGLPHSSSSSENSNLNHIPTESLDDCGTAASFTLPSSPVVDDGLPQTYVIPAGSTAAETVVITYALEQLGKPYLWGGAGPGAFDCSGLTMMAWAQAGVTLLHYTGDQINEGTPVASYADISPGDLVLVPGSDGTVANPGHVGLYIGEGLVESAVDVQYGVIVQSYSSFVSGGLSGIRHVG